MLDDIVDKYNNTVHRTTDDYYAECNEDSSSKKIPKFKVGDNVRISK